MNDKKLTQISKLLSLALRHEPSALGITLDEQGWTGTISLLAAVARKFPGFNMEQLEEVVEKNNKKRFAFNDDKTRIRANQGHSVEVDLALEPVTPPEFLYHGTARQFVRSILESGIQKMQRHHVHLSKDVETAVNVGGRKGKVVVLKVHSGKMHAHGILFYCSANGVWLTDEVPPGYVEENK